MNNDKHKIAVKKIKSVTNLALVVNTVLSGVKLLVGFLGGSMALVADGVHSFSDMATDLVVLVGVHFGAKEPDREHPYGHGRAETLAAIFISLFLMLTGAAMIYRSSMDITAGRSVRPGILVLIVAVVSILSKEILCRVTKAAAIKFHSTALYANAWHQRSDAISSVVVVVGFVSLKLGFAYGDQLAAIGVGLMIVLIAIRILSDCISEFTERAVDEATIEDIKNIINAEPAIRYWHKLRTRTIGREVFLDLHMLVDAELNIAEAHAISEKVETALHEKIIRPVNITIHIEPDLPELRKHL